MALFMQFAFCAIINDSFTVKTIDDSLVHELKNWRTFSGHDLKWIDPISHHSLARRVCDKDESLPMSYGVMAVLELIRTYSPRKEDRDFLIRKGSAPAIGY